MVVTSDHSGSSGGVTSRQSPPPSRDTCTRPSSLPAHITPFSCGDSAKAKIVHDVSAPDASLLMGPPDVFIFSASLRVRSGLTASQLWPSSVERKTRSPHAYTTRGSWGEKQ